MSRFGIWWELASWFMSGYLLLCPPKVEGAEGALWGLLFFFPLGSFTKALIPFIRAPPSWPNHLPKAPPPNTITLGVRFQHMNLRMVTFGPQCALCLLAHGTRSVGEKMANMCKRNMSSGEPVIRRNKKVKRIREVRCRGDGVRSPWRVSEVGEEWDSASEKGHMRSCGN